MGMDADYVVKYTKAFNNAADYGVAFTNCIEHLLI